MSVCCSKLVLQPLFSNIKENDFKSPLKKLVKHYPNVAFYRTIKPNSDQALMYYAMCRPDIRVTVSLSKNTSSNPLITSINLNDSGARYMLFQLLSVRKSFNESSQLVSELIPPNKKIHYFKISFGTTDNDGPNVIYQSTSFLETVIAAKLLLHSHNKWYLENSDYNNLSKPYFWKGFKSFNQAGIWFYKNFSLLDLERVMIVSGVFWMYLGQRPAGDIDVLISKEGGKTQSIQKVIDRFYVKTETGKFVRFADPSDQLSSNTEIFIEDIRWWNYFDYLMAKPAKYLYNIQEPNQFHFYPQCYVYWYGFKCVDYRISMINRYIRNRPRAVAELIVHHLKFPESPIPPLPKWYIKTKDSLYNRNGKKLDREVENSYTDFEIKIGRHTNEFTGNIEELKIPVDKKKWINTVAWYLRRDYRITNLTDKKIKKIIKKAPKFDIDKILGI
jgi:hypothetical protein